MESADLKLLKDELETQLHSYRSNQFSEDLINHCSGNTEQSVLDLDLETILSAKNEWESCVDSLEHQAMIILDHELKVVRVNRTVEIWGWGSVTDVCGTHVLTLINPALENDTVNDLVQLDIQANTEWESHNSVTDRKYRFSFYPNRDIDSFHHDDSCYAVLLVSDITIKKLPLVNSNIINRRKKDLFDKDYRSDLAVKTEKRMHQLAEQLINSQEDERKRVSSELHDGVGQILSALKFQIESVVSESNNTSKQRKNDVVLSNVLDNIKVALTDLRRISVDLRPSVIDDLGLLMALKWFVGEYIKVYKDVKVDLQLDVQESTLSDKNKNIIYRIIQEAMNNIAKHAHAENIFLQLTKSENGLLLRISDDGHGFDLDEVKKSESKGLGLKSMEERALDSGANFTMSSNPSSGTTIQIFWKDS